MNARQLKKARSKLREAEDKAYQEGNIAKGASIDEKLLRLQETKTWKKISKKQDEKFIRKMNR